MTTASQTLGPSGRSAGAPRRRSLAILLAGEGVDYAGDSVQRVALPALAVLGLGASPGQVALLAFAGTIPALLVSLPAGVLLDRYPLRAVLVTTDLAAAAVVIVIPAAAFFDELTMPLLYSIALALGSLSVLHTAASMVAVPLLSDAGQRHRANSLFTAVITTAGVAGSALGTVLVATVGPARTLLADVASFIVSACCAARVRALPTPDRTQAARRPMLDEIREGLRYSARDDVLRPVLTVLTATAIGKGLTVTLLAYHLLTAVRVGTTGLGLIMAAGSLGGLTGALVAPRLTRRYGSGTVLATGFTVHALMQIPPLVAAPGPAWLAALAVAAGGHYAAATCVGTTQRSVQQWITPLHLRTRVQQTALWLSQGSQPLAALAAGGLAAVTSVRAVMLAGVLVHLLSAGMLWRSPVRRLTVKDAGGAR
ncbi:MFS transporter [Streptomyces sp. NPDC046985]|uniref:MFS transporter n=1 Tax=Streptomyces sp. NPDC046985 TaxID=3155377 RepID=UPI0033FE1CF4